MKRLYKIFTLTALLFGGSVFYAGAQNLSYEWGVGLGGANNEIGKYLTTDNDGNVILISDFEGSYDADPGTGTTTLTPAGSSDISIAKYDPDGNLIWAKSIGGAQLDQSNGLDVDSNNNIYVSGGFDGTADFDPGTGVENRTSAGGKDIFLLKLDMNGDFAWVYTNGSNQNETAKAVAVNSNDEVLLTGYFRLTVDFDPGAGTANLTSLGSADAFVLKLDNAGDFQSVYHVGGANDEDPYDIAVDALDNVYVSGAFQGTPDFDPGAGTAELTSAGGSDLFVFKITPANNFGWAKRVGDAGNDFGNSIAIDSDLNVIIGGSFQGTVDFDPDPVDTDNKISEGSDDLLVIKLDKTGDYLFGVAAGGVNSDFIQDISMDDENNIFSTGVFRYTVDFDPSTGVENVSVSSNDVFADQFFWKLDADGNYLFAENLGGTDNDHGFVVHTDGQLLYTTGYFKGTADLDLTANTDNVTVNGGSDISFSKHINCNPISTNDVIVACSPITWIDGNTYSTNNNTATMMLSNQYGCDSLVTLNFTLVNIADQTLTPSELTYCDAGNPTIDLGSSEEGVFYTLLDESNGNVLDGPVEGMGGALSMDGGNITASTTYEVVAEKYKNNALSFTGNGASPTYVSLGNKLSDAIKGTNQITVEAWAKTASTDNLQSIVSNYTDFGNTMQFLLRLDDDGGTKKASFWIGTGQNPSNYIEVLGTSTILQNTWYHIAGTYDGTELAVYVNGVKENSITVTTDFPYIDAETKIGGGLSNDTEYFNGEITNVRLWNIARTETEIDTEKDQCIAGNTPGLLAMYNMTDGEGSGVLTDASVNGYDGTLTNMDPNAAWNYNDLPDIACWACQSSMTQMPTVTVDVTPTAGVQDNGDGTFSATGSGDYQWIDCATENPVMGETSATFAPTVDGDYAVIVSNNNCADTSDCVTFSTVGLSDNGKSTFSAYPNPTNNLFTITSSNTEIALVVLHDAAGREIVKKQSSSATSTIDLSEMKNGIYFVTIFGADNSQSNLKVIKK